MACDGEATSRKIAATAVHRSAHVVRESRALRILRCMLRAGAIVLVAAGACAARTWTAEEGRVALRLDDRHLESLGLRVEGDRPTVAPDSVHAAGGPVRAHAFAAAAAVRFRTEDGAFRGLLDDGIPVRGGLTLRARSPRTGEPLPPALLYDFTVAIDPDDARHATIRTADPDLPVPLEVQAAALHFAPAAGRLAFRHGDVRITEAWARRLGEPLLAGQCIGEIEIELTARVPDLTPAPAPPDHPPALGPRPDVELAELYGITSFGRAGTYPLGRTAVAAITTSCNVGPVAVPWSGPMSEEHPFIGLAMYRVDAGGTLEMIGRSWMKHGNFAATGDLCNLGCASPPGTSLGVGCSDTYSASQNASRYFLGPRDEVNPHSGAWSACGSYFDAVPADCARDYFGNEVDPTAHRLAVADADLAAQNATFFYEAQYVVAGDTDPWNGIGWRECGVTRMGTTFGFHDLTPVAVPTLGPLVTGWGDAQGTTRVAADDGNACLSVRVTALGGGQWHYEYALFNWTSARGVRSFEVPVGTAVVTNPGFRDPDDDAANDWTPVVAGGRITWSTADWSTDPGANALRYQTLFNFRFDADAPPVGADALGGLFEPGAGTAFSVATRAPAATAIARPGDASASRGPRLEAAEPNPFRSATSVAFTLDRPGTARLAVIDVTGRTVRVLLDGPARAGRTGARWDGRGPEGRRAAPGVYFLRLEAGGAARTVRATLLR